MQVELETQEEELKRVQEQLRDWQEYTSKTEFQLNIKILRLDTEKKESQRAKSEIQ